MFRNRFHFPIPQYTIIYHRIGVEYRVIRYFRRWLQNTGLEQRFNSSPVGTRVKHIGVDSTGVLQPLIDIFLNGPILGSVYPMES